MERRLKYDFLFGYLARQEPGSNRLWLTFEQIEGILNEPLPPSAYKHSSCGGNRQQANYVPPHAAAWHKAGWRVGNVNLARRVVEFERE